MMIAIASDMNDLSSVVGAHFGKSRWFYLFDTNRKEGMFIENPALEGISKVGCEVADFLVKQNVKQVVAGRFGSNVMDRFRKNHVQMVIPQTQVKICDIIEKIK